MHGFSAAERYLFSALLAAAEVQPYALRQMRRARYPGSAGTEKSCALVRGEPEGVRDFGAGLRGGDQFDCWRGSSVIKLIFFFG